LSRLRLRLIQLSLSEEDRPILLVRLALNDDRIENDIVLCLNRYGHRYCGDHANDPDFFFMHKRFPPVHPIAMQNLSGVPIFGFGIAG